MNLGKEREVKEFKKYVGVGEFYVVGFNLTKDEIAKKCGYEVKQEPVYSKKSGDGNNSVSLTIFLKEKNSGNVFRTVYYIEDKARVAADGKPQFVNNRAMSSYVEQEWFTKNDYRPAFVGEADFFNFLKNWLTNLDWFSDNSDTKLDLKNDTQQLLAGNVKWLNDLAMKYSKQTVGLLSGVKTSDGKEYQDIYNKAALAGYSVSKLQDLPKGMSMQDIEKQPYAIKQFLKQVEGQYGYQHYFGNTYSFREYNPKENALAGKSGIVSSNTSTTPATGIDY